MKAKKKGESIFTPGCPGCEELRWWATVSKFVRKADKEGTGSFIPTHWRAKSFVIENEHFRDCRWHDYVEIVVGKKIGLGKKKKKGKHKR